jgi:hypothetical protein
MNRLTLADDPARWREFVRHSSPGAPIPVGFSTFEPGEALDEVALEQKTS